MSQAWTRYISPVPAITNAAETASTREWVSRTRGVPTSSTSRPRHTAFRMRANEMALTSDSLSGR